MILVKARNLLGMSSLFAEIVILNFVLLWLRGRPSGSAPAVLALGNLILGLPAIFPLKSLKSIPRPPLKLILIWSASYCITYEAFVEWPNLLPLSTLRIAQTIAPTAAVFITGDWKSSGTSRFEITLTALAISLLIMAVLARNGFEIGRISFLVFLGIAICYVGFQSAARLLSRGVPPFWTSINLSFVNGIILVLLLIFQKNASLNAQILRDGFLLAFMILLVQVLLLSGLKWALPFVAGLTLTLAVPITVIHEAIFEHKSPGIGMLAICLLFFAVMIILAQLKRGSSKPECIPVATQQ